MLPTNRRDRVRLPFFPNIWFSIGTVRIAGGAAKGERKQSCEQLGMRIWKRHRQRNRIATAKRFGGVWRK
jgi:hypothetical protein